jgi:hypothetical protein
MCGTDKFVISQSFDNEFVITIKQQGSTLPMLLTATDTFEAKLFKLDTNTEAPIDIVVSKGDSADYVEGKLYLTISKEDAATLTVDRGSKADRYYLLPTYRLAIDSHTNNNGNFIAKINTVYVDR